MEYSHSKTLGLLQISVLITKLLLNGALTLQFVQFLSLEVSLEENWLWFCLSFSFSRNPLLRHSGWDSLSPLPLLVSSPFLPSSSTSSFLLLTSPPPALSMGVVPPFIWPSHLIFFSTKHHPPFFFHTSNVLLSLFLPSFLESWLISLSSVFKYRLYSILLCLYHQCHSHVLLYLNFQLFNIF